MKISMSVMIVFTTLLCILPFAWFILIGKNMTRKKDKLFKSTLKGENVSLDIKEQWNDNFIGIDDSLKVLMFLKLNSQETSSFRININDIKNCQIVKVTRDLKKGNKMDSELQRIDLELTVLSKKENISLNFYDINEAYSEDMELKRAEKWEALILHSKNNISPRSMAA